jgi:hypothetical protein
MTPAEEFCHVYGHALAKMVLDGATLRGMALELVDGVEARRIPFVYDGKPCETFGMFREGVAIGGT